MRLESLERAALSEKDKERIHVILTSEDAIHYMSSEESDQEAEYSGNGPNLGDQYLWPGKEPD